MISEETLQKIKDENDIVDVISEYVRLKRAGNNYLGLCPFHHEKTPSFSVSRSKQIYKCFGCGEAGNVISFIMKHRNLSFIEAVKALADRANIVIDGDNPINNAQNNKKQKLYKINTEAARYFFRNLNNNSKGKNYFIKRGISEVTIRRFGLGFARDDWKGVYGYLRSKGYSELELVSAGLVINGKNNSIYDRFRNRVIFPVFNYKGKVIGFGGRVLDDSKPKYLNSPETLVFNKGINLYGLNFALKNKINDMFIMVEGYMDCISLHQAGITNVVASLGTALTINQAKLLKRYANKVIISYDADLAGQTATIRGLKILKSVGFDVRVLIVPQGKDPDEYVRNNGKEAFLKLAHDALPLIEYRLKRAKEGINLKSQKDKITYIKNVTLIMKDLDPIERDVYIKKVSEESGIKEQAIYDLINEKSKKNTENQQEMNNLDIIGQKLYLEPAYIKAERSLLKLMLTRKECFNYIIDNIVAEDFNLDSHREIYKYVVETKDLDLEKQKKAIELRCDNVESSKEWVNINEEEIIESECDIEKLMNDFIVIIKKFKLEESKKNIMSKIKEFEAKGLVEQSLNLVQSLEKIQKNINNI